MTHKEWIMTQTCAAWNMNCGGTIVSHHVRTAANAGTGMKPGDEWLVPLCDSHHMEGHHKGWKTFERKYGVDLKAIAVSLAANSPALRKPKP